MMMLKKIALPILLIFLLVSATTTLVAATSLTIPTIPLSSEMRSLPIKVSWVDSGACTQEEVDAIKNALDIALGILAGGASKLENEYPEGFQGFSSFKFEKTSDASSAQIIVTDADLERIGGQATIRTSGGKVIPPSRVEISCDAVSAGTDALTSIIMHELLHALGLGHTSFSEYSGIKELMYKVLTDPKTYPSTLDFYAVYQLVIKGYGGDSVSLPEWLPYGQVTPQKLILPEEESQEQEESGGETTEEATLEELERKYENLENKYDSLSNAVADLRDDVQEIEERLDELEERVSDLEENVSVLKNETATLEERLNATESTLINHTQRIAWLNESVSRLGKSLEQLDGLEERLAHVEEELGGLNGVMERLMAQLSYVQSEWSRKFSNLSESQKLLEDKLEAQQKQFNKEILSISQQLNYTKSDIEDLRLKVMELEKELQNREREIMRLRRCGLFLLALLIVSIVIAAIALRRTSKAAKAVGPPKTEDD